MFMETYHRRNTTPSEGINAAPTVADYYAARGNTWYPIDPVFSSFTINGHTLDGNSLTLAPTDLNGSFGGGTWE